MSLFIGVDVQGGQRADHLLERQECGRNGLCLVMDKLFTRDSPDLKMSSIIFKPIQNHLLFTWNTVYHYVLFVNSKGQKGTRQIIIIRSDISISVPK